MSKVQTENPYLYRDIYEDKDKGILPMLKKIPETKRVQMYRKLCLTDTYFLLRYACEMHFLDKPYAYEQCKFVDDVEFNQPGGLHNWMFLWFREGYKSTILNTGKNIQHILQYPERSTLILSNNNKGVKLFVGEIKKIFETSKNLKAYFPEVLWENPEREATPWSLDNGIIVKRKSTSKEPTLSGTGLIDGHLEKVHVDYMCYDDVVTQESVETDHMIQKTNKAMSLSKPLGKNIAGTDGFECVRWYIGTIYDDADAWCTMIEDGIYKSSIIKWHIGDDYTPRVHTRKKIEELQNEMSPYDFDCQYNLNPIQKSDRKFDMNWFRYYEECSEAWNHVILMDPAGEPKEKRGHDQDYTSIQVWGRDYLANDYLVDGVRDRITLFERVKLLFHYVVRYKVTDVWVEADNLKSLLPVIESEKIKTGVYFEVHEFIPRRYGPKNNRIEHALMPRMKSGRMFFPRELIKISSQGERYDLVSIFRNELKRFPYAKHDDVGDCAAQLLDVTQFGSPKIESYVTDPEEPLYTDISYFKKKEHVSGGTVYL